MKFKIIKSVFLKGLEEIQKAVIESVEDEHLAVIVESVNDVTLERGVAFREGLVAEYNESKGQKCPICGGTVGEFLDADDATSYVCEDCEEQLPHVFFDENKKTFVLHPERFAAIIQRELGLKDCRRVGMGCYQLGGLFGRRAFFCVSPQSGFFNTHTKDTVVIALDTSSVPEHWAGGSCQAIAFDELFSADAVKGVIRFVPDVLKTLRTDEPERRRAKNRIIHERREMWLQALGMMLAVTYRANDFRRGRLTASAALRWFKKTHQRFGMNARTLARDMEEFAHFDPKNGGAYDKREAVIVWLLKQVAKPDMPQSEREALARRIADALYALEHQKAMNGGVPVELDKVGWVVSTGGKSERVLSVSEDAVYGEVDASFVRESGVA